MALADEGDEFPHQGTVDFINNRISPTTGTLEIRGVFDNPLLSDNETRMFKPGMFVRIRVPVGDPFEAVLVPQAAIGTDQGRQVPAGRERRERGRAANRRARARSSRTGCRCVRQAGAVGPGPGARADDRVVDRRAAARDAGDEGASAADEA